jgi:2'-5' RNA ligase
MEREYSLWLIPNVEEYRKLADFIRELSVKYYSPCFPPHLTLVSGFDLPLENVLEKTSKLAQILSPVEVIARTIMSFNEYYRCLFVKAEETPGLLEANRIAMNMLGLCPEKKYFPHLSLMYGQFSERTKGVIASETGNRFDMKFLSDNLAVYDTANGPRNWKMIEEFKLNGEKNE